MKKTYIDMSTYKRKEHFDYFRSLPYPYLGTTAEVDVTHLLAFCRTHHVSFYLMFLHEAALAADSIPEFRQRIEGDGIADYNECPTSHTELKEDGTYCYCTLYHHMPLSEYLKKAQEAREACRNNGIEEDAEVAGMYFISTLPWIRYTSLIQPVACSDESNPRITWGKYTTDETGRTVMPLSVLLHHALADGSHIGRYYEILQRRLDAYQKEVEL